MSDLTGQLRFHADDCTVLQAADGSPMPRFRCYLRRYLLLEAAAEIDFLRSENERFRALIKGRAAINWSMPLEMRDGKTVDLISTVRTAGGNVFRMIEVDGGDWFLVYDDGEIILDDTSRDGERLAIFNPPRNAGSAEKGSNEQPSTVQVDG